MFLSFVSSISFDEGAEAFSENIQHWTREFPKTDFSKRLVKLSDIRSDGAVRDSIPSITGPQFISVAEVSGIGDLEPVISFKHGEEARAYPLRIMLWHEIVNDMVGGLPVVVTYCALCNSGVIFERQIEGKEAVFGNTGRLRNFDMVMYDYATESWWQQFSGQAIIGKKAGVHLKALPSRVEALGHFRKRFPTGKILIPNDPAERPYGTTPFVRMDSSAGVGLGNILLPDEVKPFERVVVIGEEAWTVKRLREKGTVVRDNLKITFFRGQNSIHDTKWIHFGRDVGNVIARRFDTKKQVWKDAVHDVTFAFAFAVFRPNGVLYTW